MTLTAAPAPLTFSRQLTDRPTPPAVRERVLSDPGFGQHFTDHMVIIDWTAGEGWQSARVQPYGPIELEPAAAVFHYGQEVFEGLKAYRHSDGSMWAFRPERNAARLQRSAGRLALPQLSTDDFLASLRELIAVDADWVPGGDEHSLYLRPFLFANEPFVGVRAARRASYQVIASPAGPYFASELSPVSLWLSTEHARAGRGGTGAAKSGGNYAASLLPQAEAQRHGCSQVLFADPSTGRIDEAGSMNVFFVTQEGALLTPAVTGSILEGITRDSIMQIARERGREVVERDLQLDEMLDGIASGAITEIFATGTAAVVTPISRLADRDREWVTADAKTGPVARELRAELTGIQHGRIADRHGWMHRLDR
ncbi:branched-chain amino acid aminotransferase [Microbacterium sp. MPKO10]|uniref:branched-chain amino acid aminotransferase n=1 Tax=Microbacterium sp. MPKO10 TaxID=2989818 RepID=UPI002235F658|nr:branched-chain amino acid aminotransferase [Microbacterium sp. MPKO10]MCW4459282.1 branched-chain amino acid aminotransferase [Microbacterium sp. MPKO10]